MPKGVPIKDHLDDPDFKILYTTLKYSNLKDTNFSQVAVEMGCKDAAFARNLLNRTMKAQGKGNPTKNATVGPKPTAKASAKGYQNESVDTRVAKGEPANKKRKVDATASEAKTEKLDEGEVDKMEEVNMKQESGTEGEEE